MVDKAQFKVSDWRGKKTLRVDSQRIDECMAFYRAHGLDGVSINSSHGYLRNDIEFLREHTYVTGVVLVDTRKIDISPLESLKDLTYASIPDGLQPMDFAQFPKLQDLSVDWHPKMVMPPTTITLTHLRLGKYKPKSKDLTELPEWPNLDQLEIVLSPLSSIEGIDRFTALSQLQLAYLTKLENIGAIAGLGDGHLDILDCNTCRKIRDHEAVRHLASLRILRFNSCGEIPNIRFLKEMPNLEDFRFVDTNVIDGDLTPCIGLKSVGFSRKKHFSHTPQEMNTILGNRP